MKNIKKIKVGSNSPTFAVAGAIAKTFREHGGAPVQAIGAGAVNQAVKAIIHAKRYLAEEGTDVVFDVDFVELDLDGRILTGVQLRVQPSPTETAVDEIMPTDTETRQGAEYLMKEETAVDQLAVPANADAITDAMKSYTDDEEIAAALAERQQKAASGRAQLMETLDEHQSKSPTLSGGDLDAEWEQSGLGEETVGGAAPTPDQDVVDELGEALGITYEDDEPLDPDKVAKRDENRWELEPASVEVEREAGQKESA